MNGLRQRAFSALVKNAVLSPASGLIIAAGILLTAGVKVLLPSLVLTSIGAKSGQRREAPLATLPDDDVPFYVVGSNFGQPGSSVKVNEEWRSGFEFEFCRKKQCA